MSVQTEQAVQIEANRSAISAHEQVCAERYARIEEKLEDGKKRFDSIEERFAKRIIRMERLLYAICIGVLVNPSLSTEFIKKGVGTMNFDQAFTRLLGHEGAYSNDPRDGGGETMWGITVRVARANGYFEDMESMPQTVAKDIYRRLYWDAVQADKLPECCRFDVFDAAVNSGVGQSIKWLQRSVSVPDDGVLGPFTLKAIAIVGNDIKPRFNGHRLEFMASLPNWPAFGRGWARRIASNLKG